MNFKIISLVLVTASFLISCGGSKNETLVDDSTILAVRSLEDATGVAEDERTQVALLSGDISTPEMAQLAAENAQWMPISQFSQDGELAFSQDQQTQNIADRVVGRNGQGNNQNRNDRGQATNNQNRNDRDQASNQSRDDRGQATQLPNGSGDRNDGRNNQTRRHDNNNWRPYQKYQQNWRPYTPRPPAQYWGYSQCNTTYIYYSGRCVLPYSSYYGNYFWQPRHYYYVNTVYRGYRSNKYNWRGRAHIRFYW